MALVPLKSLGLGDVVRISGHGAFEDATVKKLNADGSVQVVRPYIQTADFSYTGGVITYIGLEDFAMHGADVELVRKGAPLK